jgi:two-component system, sensor histidine kinase
MLFPDRFEPALEQAYQGEWRRQIVRQVALSIRVAIYLHASFIVVDLYDIEIAPYGWLPRIVVIGIMMAVLGFLTRQGDQAGQWVTLCSATVIGAVSIHLLVDAGLLTDKGYFLYYPPGAVLIVAYAFGPLAMPVALGTLLGLSLVVALCMIGYHEGLSSSALLETGFDMVVMVFIGAFTRYQLETFSRQTFLEKRTAEVERDKAESARQVAEQAVREKSEFLRNASHNLRQPLQALVSYAAHLEVTRDDLKPLDVEPARVGLLRSVDLLASSFNKILDLNKLDSQRLQLEAIPIKKFLENIQQQYQPLAQAKGIRLKVVSEPHASLSVRSDDAVLSQIIGNLVDNAVKYTAKGWVLAKPTVMGDILCLHIVDSGHGIDDAQQEAIFHEFVRVERPDDMGGFGLGLAYVAKAIARLPAHRQTLYSRVGRGTHIRLDIPLAHRDMAKSPVQETPDATLLRGKSVLLVEDNQWVLEAMAGHLQSLGMQVEKARSTTEVRLIVHDRLDAPDLVLTDWMLAGGETAESVVACVQSHCGLVPTLIVSGEIHREGDFGLSGQCSVFLKKPVNSDLLVRTLTQMLSSPGKSE